MIKNDSYNWVKGGEPLYPDAHTHLGAILGGENMEKYSDIFPVLCLIFLDINTRYITTGNFNALFRYDEDPADKGAAAVMTIARKKLFESHRAKAAKLPKKKAVMLSSTFVHNPRYTATIAQFKKLKDTTHILSVCDVRPEISRKGIKLNSMHYTSQPIVLEDSVSGKKLKWVILEVASFLAQLIKDGKTCADYAEKADKLLSALQQEYTLRINWLCEKLSAFEIERYITINQYSLREVMILDACHRLGIPTRQMEHHSSWCMHPSHRPVPIYRYAYTDSFGCWSESDLHFHKNFYCYQPMFGQQVELYTVGNPEVTTEKGHAEYAKYTPKNQIVYMVSGIMDENNQQLFDTNFAMQQRIFAQLAKLKEKTGWEVLVRFPPAINPKMMAKCTPVLEGMGIKVSQSIAGTLMEDMCTSRVVFGTISSVLSTAVIMGRKVYRIVAEGFEPLYTEEEITSVAIDDIENIADDWSSYPLPLEEKRFINYNLLLKD